MTSSRGASDTPPVRESGFEIFTSRQFPAWLASQNAALAISTYETGKLFLVGLKMNGRLSVVARSFNRAMGLCADGEALWLGTQFQLWRFQNLLEPGQRSGEYDRLYVPMTGYTTGDIDIHDIGVKRYALREDGASEEGVRENGLSGDGQVVFVSTLFSCLATVDSRQSFRPLWRPPYITQLAPEDRCHLNGLAMKNGKPAYVTSVSRSDAAAGWRDRRGSGGVVVEVASGEVVIEGLSMPHSPRWHDGELYLLDSGSGFFGRADFATRQFEPIAFVPGYLRGLAFAGNYALVGASKPRKNRTFTDLLLDENLKARDVEPRCGVYVIDLANDSVVHWLNVEGAMGEMYDVAVLPGTTCPGALGFSSDEIQRTVKLGPRLWTAGVGAKAQSGHDAQAGPKPQTGATAQAGTKPQSGAKE